MAYVLVTLDVSHCEILPLKVVLKNMNCIFVQLPRAAAAMETQEAREACVETFCPVVCMAPSRRGSIIMRAIIVVPWQAVRFSAQHRRGGCAVPSAIMNPTNVAPEAI